MNEQEQTDGLHSLGKTGTDEKVHADEPESSDHRIATSKPIVGVSGIFWQQTFQSHEQIPERAWIKRNRLAD